LDACKSEGIADDRTRDRCQSFHPSPGHLNIPYRSSNIKEAKIVGRPRARALQKYSIAGDDDVVRVSKRIFVVLLRILRAAVDLTVLSNGPFKTKPCRRFQCRSTARHHKVSSTTCHKGGNIVLLKTVLGGVLIPTSCRAKVKSLQFEAIWNRRRL